MEVPLPINKRTSFSDWLLDIIVVAILALILIPQLRFIDSYNYVFLLGGLSWVIVAFFRRPFFFFRSTKYILISLSFFASAIFLAFISDNESIVNRYASLMLVPMFYWMYSYNASYRGIKSNVRIVCISLIFITVTSLQTIAVLLINPYASRSLKTSIKGSEELISEGVAEYGFIYSVVIIVIVMIPLILDRKQLKLNFALIVPLIFLLAVCAYLIILSNYFTALIISLLGVLSVILLYKSRKIFFLLIPLAVIYFGFHKEINIAAINVISSFTQPDGKTYMRLQELKMDIGPGVPAENINTRSGVMNTSFDLFIDYPLLGYVTSHENNFDLKRVGQHSYILDTYALFGVFLGTLSLWVMWLPFRYRIGRQYRYQLRVFGWVAGLTFILLITFNNLTPAMGYAAFFVFPTVFDYINSRI